MDFSVVIVTVGRPRQLAATLASLEELAPETPAFEVLIVLDGDDPESRAVASRSFRFPSRVLAQDHAGISTAKNTGVREGRGTTVLFLNDDTRPEAGCLRAHAEAHARFGPGIIVGQVEWDPRQEITPYMAWLAPAGHQFNFARLRADMPVPWDACWGAHVSAPRTWLLDEPFDPLLRDSALEDGEWGYRQVLRGRPLRYVPWALAFHDHYIAGPRDYVHRPRAAGAAARHVAARHRRLAFKLLVRPALACAAASALALLPWRWRRTTGWDLAYRWAYVQGMLTPRAFAGRRRGRSSERERDAGVPERPPIRGGGV